jgi:hypothetical protein
VVDGILEDLDLGKENTFNLETFFHEELIEFLLESLLNFVAAMGNVLAFNLGKDVTDAGTGVGTDDFANEVITDIFPEFGGVSFVNLEKNGAFDADTLVVFGGGQNWFITESLFIVDIKAVSDGVLENLSVEELGDLPERDLQMKAWPPDPLEDAVAAIVDTGNVAGGDRDEETTDDFVDEETNYQFVKISHTIKSFYI